MTNNTEPREPKQPDGMFAMVGLVALAAAAFLAAAPLGPEKWQFVGILAMYGGSLLLAAFRPPWLVSLWDLTRDAVELVITGEAFRLLAKRLRRTPEQPQNSPLDAIRVAFIEANRVRLPEPRIVVVHPETWRDLMVDPRVALDLARVDSFAPAAPTVFGMQVIRNEHVPEGVVMLLQGPASAPFLAHVTKPIGGKR